MGLGFGEVANFHAKELSVFVCRASFRKIGFAIGTTRSRRRLFGCDLQSCKWKGKGLSDGKLLIPRIEVLRRFLGKVED